ncbi:MAG: DNA cytosine methyltransferase [Bacillota bacterium]
MKTNNLTYISLFSSAGVGCYGFKSEGFECVATNELIQRRLDIQRFNNKCKYESGYICGDISTDETKSALTAEIEMWKKKEKLNRIDVVIATPPCQGMSVANHKKADNEIIRNSLVIESIKLIKEIKPRFFIFENVAAFMKTTCTDVDNIDKSIADAIQNNLGGIYSYISKIINFKEHGACSSRQRTLVIGVLNELADDISPYELYPSLEKEKTLREVIGHLKSLKTFGEIDSSDIYHAFRVYPDHMRDWIRDLKEGQSAFENEDDNKKPHQVKDGKIVINQQKNGDKYKRQYWDKVGPCIHTRNDQLASQNTVHPMDDRVFSIRELMCMMTVPPSFKWVTHNVAYLNSLPFTDKQKFLKKEEIKIRQSLGEAVPTVIFQEVAKKISFFLGCNRLRTSEVNKVVSENDFSNIDTLINFIESNPMNLSVATLGKIAELSNTSRTDHAAFFTSKALITEMLKNLPITDKDTIRILEPSVGVGNFVPLIVQKFEGKDITLDVVDIDGDSISILKALIRKYKIDQRVEINYICDDFLLHEFDNEYDYIIGNPPFYKMKSKDSLLSMYKKRAINKNTTNICSFFLDKASQLSDCISLVFPKFILNTPEFQDSRNYLAKKSVDCIIDFGEKGFPGVLVETIALIFRNDTKLKQTKVISYTHNISLMQDREYIFDNKLPYWIIYRNSLFDAVSKKLDFSVFTVFRDRQIVNKYLSSNGDIRVLKSRNINDAGTDIVNIDGYDSYISVEIAPKISVSYYLNDDTVFLTPNMTYKPRVIKKPKGVLVNGSVAILIPKDNIYPTPEQLLYFSSDEYRRFYQIARNYQTRSLNVDACSVFFYGLLRQDNKEQPIIENLSINKHNSQLSLFESEEDIC